MPAFTSSVPSFSVHHHSLCVCRAQSLSILIIRPLSLVPFASATLPSASATIFDVIASIEPCFNFGTCRRMNRVRSSPSLKMRVFTGRTTMETALYGTRVAKQSLCRARVQLSGTHEHLIEAAEIRALAPCAARHLGGQDVGKLAPPHLYSGRFPHAEEREEKGAERVQRGRDAVVRDDNLASRFQDAQGFAHRFFAVLLRLLVQKEKHQYLVVRRVGKSERRGVHPLERRRSPVRQFALQVFELNRQD